MLNDPINTLRAQTFLIDTYIKFEEKMFNYLHMLAAVPLGVITTNRILNTAISRSGTANSLNPFSLVKDFMALRRIGGHKTLMAGLVPTMFYYMFYKDPHENKQKIDNKIIESAPVHVTTARLVLQERFGQEKSTFVKDEKLKKDIESFEKIDAANADKEWIPWSHRHVSALYRLLYEHEDRIYERLSEVFISTDG